MFPGGPEGFGDEQVAFRTEGAFPLLACDEDPDKHQFQDVACREGGVDEEVIEEGHEQESRCRGEHQDGDDVQHDAPALMPRADEVVLEACGDCAEGMWR